MANDTKRTVLLVKKINSSNFKGTNAWQRKVIEMKTWYEHNIKDYKQSGKGAFSQCKLLGKKVRHDCSGFVGACLQYFGVKVYGKGINGSGDGGQLPKQGVGGELNLNCPPTAKQYLKTFGGVSPYLPKRLVTMMSEGGFSEIPYSASSLKPFDIIVSVPHIEIYCGKYYDTDKGQFVDLSYTWGSAHPYTANGKGGMPSPKGNRPYKTIWRYPGASTEIDLSPVMGKGDAPAVEKLETSDVVATKVIKEDLDNLTYAQSSSSNSGNSSIYTESSLSEEGDDVTEEEILLDEEEEVDDENALRTLIYDNTFSSFQDLSELQLENGLPAIGSILF